ncbi:nucleotidyltransferase [Kaistia algarum]|uniref:Y-family DNA polymerase n=1 Tax=Kaistia algarum TaxID=2083279 RepID=UPI000CE90024|nr:DNA polymerase Y family protein [Kaistia algarum]MCX5513632.1 DNA polymerase Y family protein [Kaistia algarum]PPE79487.1 nucleotidyltransferase [Kaistia algarum]
MRIAAPDPAALRLGLGPGLALAEARARIADPDVADIDSAADDALMERLADGCERYTPLVARQDGNELILDITGVAPIFKGEAALFRDLLRRLAASGLTAHGAIAGASEAARALARTGRSRIIKPGHEAQAVRPLPVAALDLGEAETLALSRAGLKTIADLVDRPRAPLAARFGATIVERLERLTGRAEHPISPRRPMPVLVTERIFFEPVVREEDISATLKILASQLARELEARGEGGRGFEACFYRVDGAVRRIAVATARPNRDPRMLQRLFGERLDALSDPLDAGFGFDLIRLGAFRTESMTEAQATLDGNKQDEGAVFDLVDQLGARFGTAHVLRFASEDTHIPERRSRLLPAIQSSGALPAIEAQPGEPPLRPLSLLDPPERIEALAEVPDGPPLRFRWRRVLHAVAHAEGPERIAPEWWREEKAPKTRDYYRVEDSEGRRFWLYRQGLYEGGEPHPLWFMHGLFA